MSKGIIMLLIGIGGLILTVIWILLDLANRKKHEEKIVQKAMENIKSSELHSDYPISNNLEENKEVISTNHSDYSGATEVMDKDEKAESENTEVMTVKTLNKSINSKKENIGKPLNEESTELLTDLLEKETSTELSEANTEIME